MRKERKVFAAFSAMVLAVSGTGLSAVTTLAADEGVTFASVGATAEDAIVLYTNDVHGSTSDDEALSGSSLSLGYAGLAAVKAEAQAVTDNVTLIDNGDCIQGSVVTTESDGADLVTLMEAVGYDINVPGNHEFDYGVDYFLEVVDETTLNYICANFYELDYSSGTAQLGDLVITNDEGNGYEIVTYDFGGVEKRVAYIALDTPESISKGTPTDFQNEDGTWKYTFDGAGNTPEEFYEIIQENIDTVLEQGADFVVVTGHIGDTGVVEGWSSRDIIANTTGIDVFLDGHAHSTIVGEQLTDMDGNTVILTSTGTKLEKIGCMKLSLDEDENVTAETYLIDTITDEEMASEAYISMAETVAELEGNYAYLVEVIGATADGLYIYDPETGTRMVRNRETNMANFIADAYMWYCTTEEGAAAGLVEPDVTTTYGGGVRADIAAGDISFSNLLTVLPWYSEMVEIVATGQQIMDFLEMGSRLETEECGGFIQVSGLTYTINMNVESSVVTDAQGMFVSVDGEYRVQDVTIGGEAIDLEKEYTVVIGDYYYTSGGDGMTMFSDCEAIAGTDGSLIDIDLVEAYLVNELDGVVPDDYANPYGEGRIMMISAAAMEAADSDAELLDALTAADDSITADNSVFFHYSLENGLTNYNSKYLYQIALSELGIDAGDGTGTYYVAVSGDSAEAATVNGDYLEFESPDTEGVVAIGYVG